MQFPLNGLALLSLIGIAQGLLMACALLTTKCGRKRSNLILALLMVTGALAFGLIILSHSDPFFATEPFEILEYALGFAVGPLLLLYVKSLIHPSMPLRYEQSMHFLPFCMCFGFGVLSFVEVVTWNLTIEWVLFHQMSYTGIVIILFLRYLHAAKRAKVTPIPNVIRISILSGFFVVMHSSQLVRLFFSQSSIFDDVVPYTGALAFFAIGFTSFKYSNLLIQHESVKTNKKQVNLDTDLKLNATRLLETMESEKLFMNRGLTLPGLADHLSLSSHYLSNLLNEELGQNFFDFVNQYRIEEAKRLLIDPNKAQLSIEGIAYEAGFKARSSFYSIFNKHLGMTPTQFRDASLEKGSPPS